MGVQHTLVPLLLDLEFLGKILLLLPFDRGPDGAIVDEIATVSDLLLIDVCFLQNLVIEEFIGAEREDELEAGLGVLLVKICNLDVNEVLQGSSVAFGDDVRETDVVPQRSEPELRNARGVGSRVSRQGSVLRIIFERLCFARCDLLSCRRLRSGNDGMSALVKRGLQLQILRNE